MWFWFTGRVHRYNGISERELDRDLAPLMLILVEAIVLLELIVDLRWHHESQGLVRRPICGLQTLN